MSCRRSSRFWGLGCPKIFHEIEDSLVVVTNLSPHEVGAQRLYEELYCARGEMENRIKEQQLGLFADRTSSATLRANQLRLYFSSAARHGERSEGG